MRKNMLAVLILAVSLANLVLSAIVLMVVIPKMDATEAFLTKVASAIELEEKQEKAVIGDMDNYILTKSTESIMINLKNYKSSKDSYVVIKGVALMLNTKNKDYSQVKKLLDKNNIKIQDIINSTYEKYTKEEAKDKKEQIKNEILEEISEMLDTRTIVDISFGSIMYQ